jgi:DNA-binding CsgD family transcriptional regulator
MVVRNRRHSDVGFVEPLSVLSKREREILEWVGAGHTNKKIARALFIEPCTVKNHLRKIYIKLGVTNRVKALSATGR